MYIFYLNENCVCIKNISNNNELTNKSSSVTGLGYIDVELLHSGVIVGGEGIILPPLKGMATVQI